jgi:hypothetical protein
MPKFLCVLFLLSAISTFVNAQIVLTNYKETIGRIEFDIQLSGTGFLNFEYERRFNYWEYDPNYDIFSKEVYRFLDTLPRNKIVCFAFSGNTGIGFADSLKTMINSYGSRYIDSVTLSPYTNPYSWAMIGKKGAPQDIQGGLNNQGDVKSKLTYRVV